MINNARKFNEEDEMAVKANNNIKHIFGPYIYQMQMNQIEDRQTFLKRKESEKELFQIIDDYIEQA